MPLGRELAAYLQKSPLENLTVLTAGRIPPNAAELLGSPRMAERLEEASGMFDRIVIDSPPVCAVTDACVVGSKTDAVLMVVQPGLTDRRAARRSLQILNGVDIKPLGVILNRATADGGYYGYGYGYGYYRRKEEPGTKA